MTIEPRLRVLSLGAGVQSTTMALMAAHGDITPMPDAALFADTGAESSKTYEHLRWLCSGNVLPFPVHRVRGGDLTADIRSAIEKGARLHGRPPFFTRDLKNGKIGMLTRQCTGDYKLDPLHKTVRELVGLKPRQRAPKEPTVEQWIGISLDEAVRMKPSRNPFIKHRWPLIEKEMTRWDCQLWLERHGYPMPPKSACVYCPYRSDVQWRDLRDNAPEDFELACQIDELIRDGFKHGFRQHEHAAVFVHRSGVPLRDADLSTAEERGQPDLFGDECEGMCGV